MTRLSQSTRNRCDALAQKVTGKKAFGRNLIQVPTLLSYVSPELIDCISRRSDITEANGPLLQKSIKAVANTTETSSSRSHDLSKLLNMPLDVLYEVHSLPELMVSEG